MRALLIAVAAVLALTAAPATARALPVAELCTPDLARGGVPADFVVDACVDATSMTLRNNLERPVLVRREGDVGAPVRVHERGSSTATVLRLLGGADELLMPGDVARWPLGAAIGTLTVTDVDAVTQSVVASVTTRLPGLGLGAEKDVRPFVAVVRDMIAAVQERATCIESKNFLRAAACDVDAASRISRALTAQLPRTQAVKLLPFALDPTRWTAWRAPATVALSAPGPRNDVPATRTLTQAPVPAPPPVVAAPDVVSPPATAPSPGVVSTPPVAAPVVPVPPPVAAAGVPGPAPAPPVNHNLDAWWASVQQQLAAQQKSPSTSGSGGNGKGNGNSHGSGRGHD